MSECVGLQKPLVYVRRPMFAEEPGLLQYMHTKGVCVEISILDYEIGNWTAVIRNAHSTHVTFEREKVIEGSTQVASIVRRIAQRKAPS